MNWHWTGLAVFSLTLPPAGFAPLAGRVSHRRYARLAPVRPRALARPAPWAVAPLNTVPRIADAPPRITPAATAAAGAAAVAVCAWAATAPLRAVKAAR